MRRTKKSAETADLLFNKSFLDPSIKGEYPKALVELLKEEGICPETREEDLEVIRINTVDFLGVNYYHPRRVTRRSTPYTGPLMPEKYFEEYTYEGQKMNFSRGWEIYEPAIYEIAIHLRDNYGNIPGIYRRMEWECRMRSGLLVQTAPWKMITELNLYGITDLAS